MPDFFKDIKDRLGRTLGQNLQLSVCMMGPRGVGKTTILTSIFQEANGQLGNSKLYLSPQGDTHKIIVEGKKQLAGIFENMKSENDAPLPGLSATTDITEFYFKMGLCGEGNKMHSSSVDLCITDFPGEFIDENNPMHNDVVDMIQKSTVIMLAIDTVHLMEDDGKFNEQKNRSAYMCSKLIKVLHSLDPKMRKLILLVPLKCEKYVVDKKLYEVDAAVIKAYQPLIDEMKTDKFKRRIALYITPIQTLGSVVFDKFGCNPDGSVSLTEDGLPDDVKFRFHRVHPGKKPSYCPAFCPQPLYYLIKFALNEYKENQDKGGMLGSFFKGLCSLFSSDLVFFEACQNVTSKIKTEGNGFMAIQDPGFVAKHMG